MPENEVHSPIGASSAYRWMNCPGSVRLYSMLKERRVTDYALTGTLAHLVGELCLRTGKKPSQYLNQNLSLGDGVHAGTVTDEIVSAVSVYVDKVRSDIKTYGGKLCIEQSFSLDWLHPGLFGRNDASIVPQTFFSDTYIYDYKNGRKAVSAEHNVQCMYYALGALGRNNYWISENVICTIVQPNCWGKDPVDQWTLSTDELYQWAYDELLPAAKRTEEPDAPCHTGEWCCFCEAAGLCPAKKEQALALLKEASPVEITEPVLPEIKSLTPEMIGKMSAFFNSEEFQSWLKALTATEADMLQRGEVVPGRKLIETEVKGNRKWIQENLVIEKLRDLCGEELFDTKLKSPAQIEKLLSGKKISKEEREELVAPLVTRDVTVKTLVVSEDDKRPSVQENKQKALELFN